MSRDAANIVNAATISEARGEVVDDMLFVFYIMNSANPVATIQAFPQQLIDSPVNVILDIDYVVSLTPYGAGVNLMDEVMGLRILRDNIPWRDVPDEPVFKLGARKN